jgi:glycosyltransferase involved in cell wall biosynthesis
LVAPAKIRELVEREAYDIVHVHTPIAAFVTRYALRNLRKTGKPSVIYTAHGFHFHQGGNPLRNAVFLGLEKLAGTWTDDLVVINREDEAAAQKWTLVPAGRLHYMPGIGVDLSCYNPKAIAPSDLTQLRQELGVAANTPLILVLAEFTARKRHRDILHAFAQLQHSTACLVMAGPGPLIPAMQQLAIALGIQDRVRFLGFRYDVPVLIRAAAAVVLASDHEGLPRSVMEALCLQTPVIGTDVRGTRDLLANGGGVLVELGNIAALSQAIAWVLDHPEAAQTMAKRGQEQMQAYDVRKILQLTDELYEEAFERTYGLDDALNTVPQI